MQSERKETKSIYIENDQAFVQSFVALLGELRDNVPKKTSLDTIRQLLVSHGQKQSRMELILTQLSNNILQHQLKTKRGPIKVISLMASVYQGELLPFFSGIVDLIIRKLKENDEDLHESLSDATGAIIQFGLKDATEDVACEHLQNTLTKLFQLCGTGHRHTQTGASKCVVKAIQNISPFHLPTLLNDICPNLFKLLRSSNCKNHFQLLESVLNVLIVYQGHPRRLEENARLLIPAIFVNLHHKEGHVRKMAIEVMSTISHLLPEVTAPYKDELLKKLNLSRYDVVKSVREISLQAITIIQKLPHCDEMIHPSELLLDQKHQDESNVEIQDQSCEEGKRSRSQGKSFELSPPRITSNQPGQHQTPQKSKETPRPSSARASPISSRPKSTDGNKHLKKNSNFFEAHQQKKEIDVIVKSPTKVNSSRVTKKEKEPNLQIFYSPDKTYKYVYSDSNSPAARKKTSGGSKSPSSPSKKSTTKGRIFSPYSIKDVKEAEEGDEISNPEGEENTKNSSQIHKDSDLSQSEKDDARDDGFKTLISQLVTVNQKQSKVKKVIKDFQATTHNEIMQLVSKINDIESAVLNKSRAASASGNSSPSNVEYESKSQEGVEQTSDEIKINEAEDENKVEEEVEVKKEEDEAKVEEAECEVKPAEDEIKVEEEPEIKMEEDEVKVEAEPGGKLIEDDIKVEEEPETKKEEDEVNVEEKSDEIKIEAVPEVKVEEDLTQIEIENLFKENKINASFEFCLNEGSDKHLLKLVEMTDHSAFKSLELSTLEKLLTKMKEIIDNEESEEGKDVLPCVVKVLQKYFELSSQVAAVYEKFVKKYGDKAKIENVDIQQTNDINEKFEALIDNLGEKN